MPQPSFISDGVTPRVGDTRWMILVKWLGALQNQAGAIPLNNPKRGDTRRILLGKIESALAGVTFPADACCANIISYDCVLDECVDPGDGTGAFVSLAECQAAGCGAVSPTSLFGLCGGSFFQPAYSSTSDRVASTNLAGGAWNDRLIKIWQPEQIGLKIIPHSGPSAGPVWIPTLNKFYFPLNGGSTGPTGDELIAIVDPVSPYTTTYIGGFTPGATANNGVYVPATNEVWFRVGTTFAVIDLSDNSVDMLPPDPTLSLISGDIVYDSAEEAVYFNAFNVLGRVDVNTRVVTSIDIGVQLVNFVSNFRAKALEYVPSTGRLWLGYTATFTFPGAGEGYVIIDPASGLVETDTRYDPNTTTDPPIVISYSSQFNIVLMQLDPAGSFPRDFGFHTLAATGGNPNDPTPTVADFFLTAKGADVPSVSKFAIPSNYLGEGKCLTYFSQEELNGEVVPSWNCQGNTCVDPNDGSGGNLSLDVCESACLPPPQVSYDCVDGACVDPGTGGGQYSTLAGCQGACEPVCEFSIDPTAESVDAPAGTSSIAVTVTDQSCEWTAVSNDAWITITSGSSGTGDGTVGFSYDENTDPDSRQGTITAAGLTYTLTQAGTGGGSITAPDFYWAMEETGGSDDRIDEIAGVVLRPIATITGVPALIGNGAHWANGSNANMETLLASAVAYTTGNDCSFNLWIKQQTEDGSEFPRFRFTSGGSGTDYINFQRTSLSDEVVLTVRHAATTEDLIINPITLDTSWHMWSIVYDGATGLGSLYRDAVLLGTTAVNVQLDSSANCELKFDAVTVIETLIDEFGAWMDYALTSGELTSLYNGGAGLTWPF